MALVKLLGQQPTTAVSHEQPPLLPWTPSPGLPGIRERIERMRCQRSEPFIGDVASFYLPYAEEAIALEPAIRIVCLKPSREETIADLCGSLDQSYRLPMNHW